MVGTIGIMDSTIHPKISLFRIGANMNEYREKSLYDILDKLSTRLVQLYYVSCWETDDKDGMRVSGNILYARNFYETA